MMTNRLRDMVTFCGGVALTDEEVVLIGGLDEQKDEPHTIVVRIDSTGQQAWSLDWSARAVVRHPVEANAVIIGIEGEVASLHSSGPVAEPSIPAMDRMDRFGRLLGARTIGDTCYVVGYNFQVLRFVHGSDGWQPMENGLPARPAVHPSVAAFEAIDGYDDTELYAAGTGGALWRYDGAFWRQIPVTTNVRLTGITASADGTVYVCGQSGVLLRGRGDRFELIEHDEDIRYFWDVSWWKDRLFILSSYVLYTWQDSKLSPYPFADLREDESLPTTFLRFLRSPSWLWTVGDKDVVRITLDTWERVV